MSILVADRLHDKEVLVSVLILPAKPDQVRDERNVTITLGIPDKETVFRSGTLADLPALIDDAWTAYINVSTAAASDDGELKPIPAEPVESTAAFTYDDDDF